MRHSLTIRLDPSVIDAAKWRAQSQNRTLTNYIETVLRRDLGLLTAGAAPHAAGASKSETPTQGELPFPDEQMPADNIG